MQTTKYNFLIGWNNKTHKREFLKAIKCLNNLNVKGYTLNKDCLGFWDNTTENSFKIEIINSEDNPFNDILALELKKALELNLNQYLVLTTKENIEIL